MKTAETYFPLKEGLTWEYEVTYNDDVSVLTITSLAPTQLNGIFAIPCKYDYGPGGSQLVYFVSDNSGIYEIATNLTDIIFRKEPSYVIKHPINIGTPWEDLITIDALEFYSINTIVKLYDMVTVPWGRCNNALKIKEHGFKILSDDETNYIIGVEGWNWFAPKVGIIRAKSEKFVCKDGDRNNKLFSEKTDMKLLSFKE
jgi:hypothetical protein